MSNVEAKHSISTKKNRVESIVKLLSATQADQFDEVFYSVASATKEEHKKVMEDIECFQKAMIDYAISQQRSVGAKCGNDSSFHVRIEDNEVVTKYTNKYLDHSSYIAKAKSRLVASATND